MQLSSTLGTETCWNLIETQFDPDRAALTGSTFMVGNGYLRYRGTQPDWKAEQHVGMVLNKTCNELLTVPNPLYLEFTDSSGALSCLHSVPQSYRHELDCRYSRCRTATSWLRAAGIIELENERVALRDRQHGIIQRTTIKAGHDLGLELRVGIDAKVWSPQARPFTAVQAWGASEAGEPLTLGVRTVEERLPVLVGQRVFLDGREITPAGVVAGAGAGDGVYSGDSGLYTHAQLDLMAGRSHELLIYAAVYSASDLGLDGEEAASQHLDQALVAELKGTLSDTLEEMVGCGYNELVAASCAAWDLMWSHSDILIAGDDKAQTLLRFHLYHSIIATLPHTERLPTYACQGAESWTHEILTMPMFLYTMPQVARRILRFRYHALDQARATAVECGYGGASYARLDGQIHISADIVYAVFLYLEVTDDWEFMCRYGAEIVFEAARFLHSFVHDKVLKGGHGLRAELDTSFFSAVQIRFALSRAAALFEELGLKEPECAAQLKERLGLTKHDQESWLEASERLVVPKPSSSLQAHVCQTFVLHHGAFSPECMLAGYTDSKPDTQHGPGRAAQAVVANWVGEQRASYEHFMGMSAASCVGEIRTAECAAVWQVVVYGFAGMRPRGEMLLFRPKIPEAWSELAFSVTFRGEKLAVCIDRRTARFAASEDNRSSLHIGCIDQELVLNPGVELGLELPLQVCHSERKR